MDTNALAKPTPSGDRATHASASARRPSAHQGTSDPRRRFTVSVRTRIVVVITAVTALCLLAVGLSVALVERHRIIEDVDQQLATRLASARSIVADGDPRTGTWSSSTDALTAVLRRLVPDDHTGAFGMRDTGIITVVPGVALDLDLRNAGTFAEHVAAEVGGNPILGTYAEEGAGWRYLAVPITISGSPAPSTVVFVAVHDLDGELAELGGSVRAFLIASALAILIVAATGIIVATRLLSPLRRMRDTARRVSAESLTERLPVVGHDDVADLTMTMNDMLDRLDHAVDAQRRLLSDVGHELKTPLTIVRGNIELMDASSTDEIRATRELVLDELDRMSRLVQDLGDASSLYSRQPLRLEPVEISELVERIAQKARGIEGAEISITEQATGSALLDPARVTQAVLQLVQNAVSHGGGRVELSARRAEARVAIGVRDHGPGVPDDAKPVVFDRFFRARGPAASSGSGLGLSIVRLIAEAHGGRATVSNASGGGALFVISLPVDPDLGEPEPDATAAAANPIERKDLDGFDPDLR